VDQEPTSTEALIAPHVLMAHYRAAFTLGEGTWWDKPTAEDARRASDQLMLQNVCASGRPDPLPNRGCSPARAPTCPNDEPTRELHINPCRLRGMEGRLSRRRSQFGRASEP
jgi:hypothetical protein